MVRRAPVPALPKSSGASGCKQAAIAGSLNDPDIAFLGDFRAHRLHGAAGIDDVLALEQAGDACFAGSKPAKHEGAVRNRFIAGNADIAGESLERRAVAGFGGAEWDMGRVNRNKRMVIGMRGRLVTQLAGAVILQIQ